MKWEQITKTIQSKGFGFVKIELEANVHYNGDCACDCDSEEECDCHSDCYSFDRAYKRNLKKERAGLYGALAYIETYNDGSVNSETTLTIPVRKSYLLPEYIRIFRETCEQMGGYDIRNAGMHITLLVDSDYDHLQPLPEGKIKNFRSQLNKMIEALFLYACDGDMTRGLDYRQPRVSKDQKYSAIYTGDDTMIEYRIFDPCYKNHNKVREYMAVVASTLYYYHEKHTASLEPAGVMMSPYGSSKIVDLFDNNKYRLLPLVDKVEALHKGNKLDLRQAKAKIAMSSRPIKVSSLIKELQCAV